jgi:hypothetical protein
MAPGFALLAQPAQAHDPELESDKKPISSLRKRAVHQAMHRPFSFTMFFYEMNTNFDEKKKGL